MLLHQMDQMEAPIVDVNHVGVVDFTGSGAEAESFKHRVDEIFVQVDEVFKASHFALPRFHWFWLKSQT